MISVVCRSAAGEHAHHHHGGTTEPSSTERSRFAASIGLVAARYQHPLYQGAYQGVSAGAVWSPWRISVGAELAGYRLTRNGSSVFGIGDLMLHGMVSIFEGGPVSMGGMMMLGAPTGDAERGLGMGHVMVMPSVWGALSVGGARAVATAGYSRGLGDASAHAQHGGGMWPLVDPMTMSELTATGEIEQRLGHALAAGAKLAAAFPLSVGDTRVVGVLRGIWYEGRFQTSAELHLGILGDPFGVRGVLQTAASF